LVLAMFFMAHWLLPKFGKNPSLKRLQLQIPSPDLHVARSMDKVEFLPKQSSMHFLQERGVDGDIG
jgi:hypothetical protein